MINVYLKNVARLFITLIILILVTDLSIGIGRAQEEKVSIPSYLSQIEAYIERKNEAKFEKQEKESEKNRLLISHVVKSGETLYSIAEEYNINVNVLVQTNELKDPNDIEPGQILDILTIPGIVYYLKAGETVWDISRRYEVFWEEVLELNQIEDARLLAINTPLIIPGEVDVLISRQEQVKQEQVKTAVASRSGRRKQEHPSFIWPVGGQITSYFGWRNKRFHYGLDIAAPDGTPVLAAAKGEVQFSGTQRGYGKVVILNHGQGWHSLYAHNSKLLVSADQQVDQGERIAEVGATGNATGPHVHLEIRFNEKKLDPLKYLP